MGMLMDMKKNAVVVQKPSGTIAVRVDITGEQRKFYNALLYVAKQEIKKDRRKTRFSINLAEIKEFFKIKDKKTDYYITALEELVDKSAEYNILNKDKKIRGKFSLLAWAESIEDVKTKEIIFNFQIPDIVLESMLENKMYANIDLVVLRGLRSKYAIILYELVKDYAKGKSEVPELDMEEFRKIFGIENKYKAIWDVKKRVLEPATSELNNSPAIDFLVSYELRRIGKRYRKIKFIVNPKPQKLKIEQQVENYKSLAEDPDLRELLFLLPESYRKRKNCVSLLAGALEKKNKEYVQAQIKYVNKKNPKNNYCGYLKQAIEKDYAGAEEIEIDFVEEEEDWRKKVIGKVVINKKTGERWKIVKVDEPDEDGHCAVRLDKVDSGEIKWIKWTEEKIKKLAGVQDERDER